MKNLTTKSPYFFIDLFKRLKNNESIESLSYINISDSNVYILNQLIDSA